MREFSHFHGNGLKFSNSVFAVTPSGPHKLSMCDLVLFGWKAREEMYATLLSFMSQVVDYIELRPSGPHKLSMCDLVLYGWKAREEMIVCNTFIFYVTGFRLYWIRYLKSHLNINLALCQTHCKQVPVFSRLSDVYLCHRPRQPIKSFHFGL